MAEHGALCGGHYRLQMKIRVAEKDWPTWSEPDGLVRRFSTTMCGASMVAHGVANDGKGDGIMLASVVWRWRNHSFMAILIWASTTTLILTTVFFVWFPSRVVLSRVWSISGSDTILQVETKNTHKFYVETLVQGETMLEIFLIVFFSYITDDTREH